MALNKKSKLVLFPKMGKIIIIIFSVAFLVVGFRAYQLFRYVFEENVKNDIVLIIPEQTTFNQILEDLQAQDALVNYKGFTWVAKKKKYTQSIKVGRYLLQKGQNNNDVVNMLRIGKQKPVKVTFNNIRFKEDLAGAVSKYILADSAEILTIFSDSAFIAESGFTPETFKSIFIPNTYEVYWNTSVKNFAKRMKIEYDTFWNTARKQKAEELGLTPSEVITLASIVQEETIKAEEKPVVAGLYINRIKKGIALQADPTIKFAIGDFTIQRVLNKHLEMDSPYNTYKYAGLPPGPINFPEVSSIDAVLNYDKNNNLYMCAKEDFSGYHNFARTISQHNRNAEKYRNALNELKIWK